MTLNSKALKDSPKRPFSSECGCPEECGTEHGRIKKILYSIGQFFMFKVYYPLESFYTRTKERIFRSYDYARFGWLNYDFDMSCAWDLLEFKLKRLRKCLQNGHAIQEPADMAALAASVAALMDAASSAAIFCFSRCSASSRSSSACRVAASAAALRICA